MTPIFLAQRFDASDHGLWHWRLVAIQAVNPFLYVRCFVQPATTSRCSTPIQYPPQVVQGAFECVALAKPGCVFVGGKHPVSPVFHPRDVEKNWAAGQGQAK